MSAVDKLGGLHVLESLEQGVESVGVECPDGPAQVPVGLVVIDVYLLGLVVAQHPGEDGVLGQVGEGPVAGLVEVHQVVVVADFAGLPHEGDLLQGLQLDAAAGHFLRDDVVDLVAVRLVLEGEVVGLAGDDLQPDVAQLVPALEQLPDLLDLDLVDRFGRHVVEGLEVDSVAGDEDVPVDVVEGQHAPGQNVGLLDCRLLRHALDQAHVEGPLVEFLDDHLVDFLLQVEVVFYLGVIVQEEDPVLQVLYLFVGGLDFHNLLQVLHYLEGLGRPVDLRLDERDPGYGKPDGLLACIKIGGTEGRGFPDGLEPVLDEGGVLVVGLVDDGLGAEVELALVLALGLLHGQVVEGAPAVEVLDVDLLLL